MGRVFCVKVPLFSFPVGSGNTRVLFQPQIRRDVLQDRSYDCGELMKRTWTIIGVSDVPQSLRWYQSLLGLPETAPAHDYFGQIVDSDGTVLLCLHEWAPTSIPR